MLLKRGTETKLQKTKDYRDFADRETSAAILAAQEYLKQIFRVPGKICRKEISYRKARKDKRFFIIDTLQGKINQEEEYLGFSDEPTPRELITKEIKRRDHPTAEDQAFWNQYEMGTHLFSRLQTAIHEKKCGCPTCRDKAKEVAAIIRWLGHSRLLRK